MKQAPAKTKTDELAVREPMELASSLPEYLREPPTEPIKGAENVRPEDFIMPRLSICSKQTPQHDEDNEKYIPDLEFGMYFNTITREVYGETIYAVPLFELNTRSFNRDYKESGPPYCQSFDGKTGIGTPGGLCSACPKSQWVTIKGKDKNQKPECTDMLNFAVLLLPSIDPPKDLIWKVMPRLETISILGFKSTSFGKGKEWITMLKLRNRDWFTTAFKLTTLAKSDGKNSWHIPVVDNCGWLSQESASFSRPAYETMYGVYRSGRMKVDEQEREEAEV